MRYLFFGSPKFAQIILQKLIAAGLPPAAVICNPDRPVGRKKIITAPPVKVLAEKNAIKVLQPESLNTLYEILNTFRSDFAIVAAYGKIIPKDIIELPRLGTIGVHPSLLPKYRGASPIQGAILNGDSKTGVTLYQMDEKVDHGAILRQAKCDMRHDTYEILEKKLAELAGDLLIETIPKFVKGEIKLEEQNHAEATFTKKFKTEDAFVEPGLLKEAGEKGGEAAEKIYNMIRALNPEPGAWTMQNGKRVKLLEAKLEGSRLILVKIQEEGKKPHLLTKS